MRRTLRINVYINVLLLSLLVVGCGTSEKQMQASDSTRTGKPEFDHKTSSDSVNWASMNRSGKIPDAKETDLEWPGERLGLIGPIIASGRTDGDEFIIVYDPAGIPVGSLTRKAYEQNPARLAELLARAQVRSEIQNLATLHFLSGNQRSGGKSAQSQR